MSIRPDQIYYAKSKLPNGRQPTVTEHLDLVSYYAAQYGEPLDMKEAAGLAGQFHDFGKYSDRFADVLRKTRQNIDHACCGAVLLYQMTKNKHTAKPRYPYVLEAINGHHDGLFEMGLLQNDLNHVYQDENFRTMNNGKESALAGPAEYNAALRCFMREHPDYHFPKIPVQLSPDSSNLVSMLYTRMLFSCLVDADYSVSAYECDSEYFNRNESDAFNANAWLACLYAERARIRNGSTAAAGLNALRDRVFEQCGEAGTRYPEGLFTLTAPTGTGKTLALLHFALRHCIATGKKRIIIVLPFLTLAEQNTTIYRKIIPDVLIDHSQSDLDEMAQEFAERWNVPFIITTSVKFFESLFSCKPTDCRKLHNIANSVVVFDEAQSLPPEVTGATLQTVNELCRRYHTTMVFSTATQPDFNSLRDVVWEPREILPDNAEFFDKLRRTDVEWRLKKDTDLTMLAKEIADKESVCVIVNLRRHARIVFEELQRRCGCVPESLFYLTTDLCPAHRTARVNEIKERLKNGLPCRVVATQCIEAGVDLDFRVLYRALAPLDAIIQAAGRCNRNGNPEHGKVVVFKPADDRRIYPSTWYGNAASVVAQLNAEEKIDIHNPEHIRRYYSYLFRNAKDKTKLRKALENRSFADTDQAYRLIDNPGIRVVVPYAPLREEYDAIRNELGEKGITPLLMKKTAPFTVSCYHADQIEAWAEPVKFRIQGKISERDSGYYILRPHCESYYQNTDMGLQIPEPEAEIDCFMV